MVILTESSPLFSSKYMIFHLINSGLIWPQDPLPIPQYTVFMVLPKKLECSSLWPFWEDFCQDNYSYSIMKVVCLSAFLTVWSVMGSAEVFLMKWAASTALSSLQLVVWWIIGDLSPRESSERNSFLLFPLSSLASLLIITMVDFHRPVLDWIWHEVFGE